MMEEQYNPGEIEARLQKQWKENKLYRAVEDDTREKFYCLVMFPYPSGKLHMGHVRNYTIGDVISRYQRLQGKNVLQPMGWDAFGLPAENAAIQNRVAPASWTYRNINYMRSQLQRLGIAYDWDRELTTCDPDYYRWEQWFFTRLFERGLVYKKESEVNWDPVDQTVLANEQVENGRGWRSGALIERRKIPQWFLKITDYADELLEGLDRLDGWPEAVKTMQRNWIGRSEGVEAVFRVEGAQDLRVFTTRPDTIMGVTYLAVAAEHPLAAKAALKDPAIAEFIEDCRTRSTAEADLETMEKKGLALGINATHPVSGEVVPVWTANFVLMSYGTGAVMAVPAHDQRDWEFATSHDIEIRTVIFPADGSDAGTDREAYTDPGVLANSGEFDGLESQRAGDAVMQWLVDRSLGERQINFRLRDWGVSRQRYWGCPIPILYAEDGEPVAVAEGDLPVVLPEDVEMDGIGSPIKKMEEFYLTSAPKDGRPARRETDTFDTFFESSWYYARFCCNDNTDAMLDGRANYWLPVDQYVGGIEHAVMHLLYARFFHKLMRDAGLFDSDEPFTRLLTQGMVIAETYYRENEEGKKTYYNPEEVTVEKDARGRVVAARMREDGAPVVVGGCEKMSKSRNNGVDPQSMIDRFGADTVRLFMMFASPPEQSLEWSGDAIAGASRFLRRYWTVFYRHREVLAKTTLQMYSGLVTESLELKGFRLAVHELGQRISRDYERQQYNTVIAACMELTNAIEKVDWTALGSESDEFIAEACFVLLKSLAPITPHLCQALWDEFGDGSELLDSGWFEIDEQALDREELTIVVQVNGKLRSRILVASGSDNTRIEAAALADSVVRKYTDGMEIVRVIVVPGKLVNIVVKP